MYMEAGVLWREEVQKLAELKNFKKLTLEHMLADNCAMRGTNESLNSSM